MPRSSGPATYLQRLVETTAHYHRQLVLWIGGLSLLYHTALFFLPPPYEVSLFVWPVTLGFVLSAWGVWLSVRRRPLQQFYVTALSVMGIWMGADLLAGVREHQGVNTWMVLDLMLATLMVLCFLPDRQAVWTLAALYVVFVVTAFLAGPPDYNLLFNMAVLMVFAAYLTLHGATVSGERAQKMRLMQELRYDGLTGALTRQAIESELAELLEPGRQTGNKAMLMLIDLDHFKQINDQCGHLTGDRVLQQVAQTLQDELGPSGLVGRWGGEEFMALLPVSSLAEGEAAAERVRRAVSELHEQPGMAEGALPRLTISLGAVRLRPGVAATELIREADILLYAAKAAGRNCVMLQESSTQPGSQTQAG